MCSDALHVHMVAQGEDQCPSEIRNHCSCFQYTGMNLTWPTQLLLKMNHIYEWSTSISLENITNAKRMNVENFSFFWTILNTSTQIIFILVSLQRQGLKLCRDMFVLNV